MEKYINMKKRRRALVFDERPGFFASLHVPSKLSSSIVVVFLADKGEKLSINSINSFLLLLLLLILFFSVFVFQSAESMIFIIRSVAVGHDLQLISNGKDGECS